ncbi:hypothetical protein KEM55_006690 [Ascosphaera atra]|nr:hypothetical protein KEM55_006690 [Ascosphaera atra]
MDLVRGKRLVRESWEKVGGSFRQKRVPVFLREEWDWEDPMLAAGAMAQCGGDPSKVKPRPSRVKETSPKKKGGVEKWAVASFEAVRNNRFVKLGEWAASAGAGDWEVAIGEAKKVLEACQAGYEYAKRDVVGAVLGRR